MRSEFALSAAHLVITVFWQKLTLQQDNILVMVWRSLNMVVLSSYIYVPLIFTHFDLILIILSFPSSIVKLVPH